MGHSDAFPKFVRCVLSEYTMMGTTEYGMSSESPGSLQGLDSLVLASKRVGIVDI